MITETLSTESSQLVIEMSENPDEQRVEIICHTIACDICDGFGTFAQYSAVRECVTDTLVRCCPDE